MRITDTGGDAFLNDLQGLAPKRKSHSITIRNRSDHAHYVKDRAGFAVMDVPDLDGRAQVALAQAVAADAPLTDADMERLLQRAADGHVARLQSFQGTTRDGRPAHPAPLNFGDITRDLASQYTSEINDGEEKRYPYP